MAQTCIGHEPGVPEADRTYRYHLILCEPKPDGHTAGVGKWGAPGRRGGMGEELAADSIEE